MGGTARDGTEGTLHVLLQHCHRWQRHGCLSMLVSVLAPAPVTNCKRRVARRAQPPPRRHNPLHMGGDTQPGGRCGDRRQSCTHQRVPPPVQAAAPTCPQHPPAHSPSAPHPDADAGTGMAPPGCPPQRGDSQHPHMPPPSSVRAPQSGAGPRPPSLTPSAGTNIPQAGKQPGEGGGDPESGRGFYLLMAGFFPQLSPQTHLSAHRSLQQIHFSPI